MQCLADLEQDGHLDQLEGHGEAAKLICKTGKTSICPTEANRAFR